MGELRNKIIVQSRLWLNDALAVPNTYDYDNTYPITVYDAVHRTMDETSTTLSDDINAIYDEIDKKQDIVGAGVANNIMSWTGYQGKIGSLNTVKIINTDASLRSHDNIPTEKAVGNLFDLKVDGSDFYSHVNDSTIHITDSERIKWNAMTLLTVHNAHADSTILHVTEDEKALWNSKADGEDLDNHLDDYNNPHRVTAHQVGTYTREEIDSFFEDLRESFFSYMNILWDDRTITASLVEYDAGYWNPNYILSYGDDLPNVPDSSSLYFAIKPATDYKTNESNDCIIYVKRPGLLWYEVGLSELSIGCMVIAYPSSSMYVWVQGRFIKLFSGEVDDEVSSGCTCDGSCGGNTTPDTTPDPEEPEVEEPDTTPDPEEPEVDSEKPEGECGCSCGCIVCNPDYDSLVDVNYKIWLPYLNHENKLAWVLSHMTVPPLPIDISEFFNGIPSGGSAGEVLYKASDDDFDAIWVGIDQFIENTGIVNWDSINGRPQWYHELGNNDDGFVTQRVVSAQITVINEKIDEIMNVLNNYDGSGSGDGSSSGMIDHILNYENPHRVTASIIGAALAIDLDEHVTDFNNPHNTNATQLGLGNVDNTSDIDKPMSAVVKDAIDKIYELLKNSGIGSGNPENDEEVDVTGDYIQDVKWIESTTSIIFIYNDGSSISIPLPIIDIFSSIHYDDENRRLVIVLPNGEEHYVDLSDIITSYKGYTSSTIKISTDSNVIKGDILDDSVTGSHIIESVQLDGYPTTTTVHAGDKSTRLATTEFVRSIVVDDLTSHDVESPLSANMGRLLNETKVSFEQVQDMINNIESYVIVDNLDSTSPLSALSANMGRVLDITKAPRVHTSASGSTYGIATVDLFGHVRSANYDPKMDGFVFIGTDDGHYARWDHIHPTDDTRAPVVWPDEFNDIYIMTGEPRAETPPDESNDTRIATTEWIRRNATGTMYGICETSGTDKVKTVTLKSTFCEEPVFFLRQIGSTVGVRFDNADRSGHSWDAITELNVQESGNAKILYGGKYMKNYMIGASHVHLFVFDGTYWNLINPVAGTGLDLTGIGPDDEDVDLSTVFTVTFNPNGGSVTPTSGETSQYKLSYLPTPERDNHSFTGWYSAIENGVSINLDTEYYQESTIYANWNEIHDDSIIVTLNAMDGICDVVEVILQSGDTIGDLPTPTRNRFSFMGWMTVPVYGGEPISSNTRFYEDSVIYARWDYVQTGVSISEELSSFSATSYIGDGNSSDNELSYVRVFGYTTTSGRFRVDVSRGSNDFAVKFASSSLIPLSSPTVEVFEGWGSFYIYFLLETPQPIGSGILVRTSDQAYIEFIQLDDDGNDDGTVDYIDSPIFLSSYVPNAIEGEYFEHTIGADGSAPIVYLIGDGSELPDGLNLALDGTISGIATVNGTFQFNVQLINNSGKLSHMFTIIVEHPIVPEEDYNI